jgi:hypothetical protein
VLGNRLTTVGATAPMLVAPLAAPAPPPLHCAPSRCVGRACAYVDHTARGTSSLLQINAFISRCCVASQQQHVRRSRHVEYVGSMEGYPRYCPVPSMTHTHTRSASRVHRPAPGRTYARNFCAPLRPDALTTGASRGGVRAPRSSLRRATDWAARTRAPSCTPCRRDDGRDRGGRAHGGPTCRGRTILPRSRSLAGRWSREERRPGGLVVVPGATARSARSRPQRPSSFWAPTNRGAQS